MLDRRGRKGRNPMREEQRRWLVDHLCLAVLIAALFMICGLPGIGSAQDTGRAAGSATNADNAKLIARGEYIVNDVAVCSQCHTPRDNRGELEHSRWLEGAALWLVPAAPGSNWPTQAPRLAGVLPGSEADMMQLLTTGIWQGEYLRPPMPQFRMSREDAEGVIAYLKSLNPHAQ
jgi:mono/diheme cytochrome c family protein